MIILIADDENLVRIYLKKIIKDMHIEDSIILEAKNGKELVSICQNYQPDLAFVDIKMPVLNGLDAIRSVKSNCPDTNWILLTGFSEFDYAIDAISLGVKEYLLKPIEVEAMIEIINRTKEHLKQKKLDSNHYFELQVTSLFNAYGMPCEENKLALSKGQLYYAFLFTESRFFKNKENSFLYQTILPKLHQWLSSWRTSQDQSALFCNSSGTLCLVIRSTDTQAARIRNYIGKLLTGLGAQDSVTVFYCQSSKGIQSLIAKCDVLQDDLQLGICLKKCAIYPAKDLEKIKEIPNVSEGISLITGLAESYCDKDEIRYNRYLEKLQNNDTLNHIFDIFSQPILEYTYQTLGLPPSETDPYNTFCEKLKKQAHAMYHQNPVTAVNLADRIKEYIQLNYANDVSIISLADTFNITPTYLSKVFHEKTGIKLIDYVSDVRILNAKRIMCENPEILIKDVTLLVGYFSTRHFTNVFLKNVGIYPSEFQKRIKSGGVPSI